jgi:hypothetical protein
LGKSGNTKEQGRKPDTCRRIGNSLAIGRAEDNRIEPGTEFQLTHYRFSPLMGGSADRPPLPTGPAADAGDGRTERPHTSPNLQVLIDIPG